MTPKGCTDRAVRTASWTLDADRQRPPTTLCALPSGLSTLYSVHSLLFLPSTLSFYPLLFLSTLYSFFLPSTLFLSTLYSFSFYSLYPLLCLPSTLYSLHPRLSV